MEGNLAFLVAAAIVTWLAILLYLLSISSRVDAVRREIEAFKATTTDPSAADEPAPERHNADSFLP